MKILHLSTSDIIGGAARTAHKFHQQMLMRGYDSTMLVLQKKETDKNIISLEKAASFYEKKLYDFKTRKIKKII